MKRNVNIWTDIDKISILIYLLMIFAGWFNIYAAVYDEEHTRIFDISQRYGKQFIWIVAAIVIAILVMIIDSRFYYFFAYPIYGGTLLMLILVLFLGTEINGAKSWFEIGSLNLQPSEFSKVATALALSFYLGSRKRDLTSLTTFLIATGIIMFPALLIAAQPDLGTTVVFLSLFLVMFREGMSPYVFTTGVLLILLFFLSLLVNNTILSVSLILIATMVTWLMTRKTRLAVTGLGIIVAAGIVIYLINYFLIKEMSLNFIILVAVLVSGIAYGIYFFYRKAAGLIIIYLFLAGSLIFVNLVGFSMNTLLKPHQKERVEILLGFKSDPQGTGYNVNQSMISIGSGGFSGKGYLQGTQTKFKFVPAQSTDFIFCTIGEEWGFLGSLVVIGLYLGLLLRLIFLAERQRSDFSRIYGYGVVAVLFIHIVINIGMTIGLVPVIGIPLPFLSYGGSSLWGFTILLFIFLRLDASRTEYLI
ncbi:MAG: rod shape-determining protein RodA [Bacteroidales bacterium]|nr:rod shape-determining protein RodA [Bacteroidales bacterium]